MLTFEVISSSFKKRIYCGRIMNTNDIIDPTMFLTECLFILINKVGEFMLKWKSAVKLNCELACEYVIKKGEIETTTNIYHHSKMGHICLSDDFTEWFHNNVQEPILNNMSEFQERDSGKALKQILYLQVNINKFNVTNCGGSSYIELPLNIQKKHAVINVKNEDNKCFLWALLSAMYPTKENPHRVSKYPKNHDEIFNLSNTHFPMSLTNIQKFEKQNKMSINVYGLEYDLNLKSYVIGGPLHFTKNKLNNHFNLLYWKKDDLGHYAWIKSLSRLLSNQLSKSYKKKFICDRCLQYFCTEEVLKNHEIDCQNFNAVRIEMPNDNNKWIKFKNIMYKERHPFVIYADFECLTTPIHTCQPNPSCSYTNMYQHHVPCAVGYQLKCSYDDTLSFYESFRGPEAAKWFMKRMKDIVGLIQTISKNIVPINMTNVEWQNYDKSVVCHICQNILGEDKVRDHCHFTGKYRGAAHRSCNLKYKKPNYIPVFFHNLGGYDSHLFIHEFGVDEEKIVVIPMNNEKYISFSKTVNGMTLRFLDSFRFLNTSLEKLVSNLDPKQCTLLHKYYPNDCKFNMLKRKGIFPYDYINSWERLEEVELPSKYSFYSRLCTQKKNWLKQQEYS